MLWLTTTTTATITSIRPAAAVADAPAASTVASKAHTTATNCTILITSATSNTAMYFLIVILI